MNFVSKKIGILLVLWAAWAGTGCAVLVGAGVGVGAAVGGAQYISGELKQTYAAPMEKAWNATIGAIETLKMKPSEKAIDNVDQNRVIKGQTEEGKDFQIALEALSKDVTTVKVRIGFFGDEAYSKRVQELIAQNLKR
jgi:hypothetical protein